LSLIRDEITSTLLLYSYKSQIRKKILRFGKWVCTRPKWNVMEGRAELGPKERAFCHRTSSSLFCKTPWLCPPWIYFFSWQTEQNSNIENDSTACNLWLISTWQKEPSDYGIFHCLLDEGKCSGKNITVQVAVYIMQ